MSDGGGDRYWAQRSDFWRLAGLLLLTVLLSNRHYHGIVQGRPQTVERIGAVMISPLIRGVAGMADGCRYLLFMGGGRLVGETALLASRAEDLEHDLAGWEGRAVGPPPFPDLWTHGTILESALARRTPARVLGADPTNWARGAILDCGSNQGIRPGDPVILGGDLVGLVTRVYGSLSIIRWITDGQTRIDLRNARTGEAIGEAVGPSSPGQDLLRLELEGGSADAREGDLLVTSGFRGFAPAGLRVGRAWRCEVAKPEGALTVWVRPFHPRQIRDRVAILSMAPLREADHDR